MSSEYETRTNELIIKYKRQDEVGIPFLACSKDKVQPLGDPYKLASIEGGTAIITNGLRDYSVPVKNIILLFKNRSINRMFSDLMDDFKENLDISTCVELSYTQRVSFDSAITDLRKWFHMVHQLVGTSFIVIDYGLVSDNDDHALTMVFPNSAYALNAKLTGEELLKDHSYGFKFTN
jgi:hypothetical protein